MMTAAVVVVVVQGAAFKGIQVLNMVGRVV